jgi:hypothetical protein
MPNIGFKAKWFFVEGLPAAAMALFLVFHLLQVVRGVESCVGEYCRALCAGLLVFRGWE